MGNSKVQSPMLTGVPAGRGKKTHRKKNKKQPKKTGCCHPLEEDPAEEDPLFKPPDSLHFQNGGDRFPSAPCPNRICMSSYRRREATKHLHKMTGCYAV
jgi:hypothetical protein